MVEFITIIIIVFLSGFVLGFYFSSHLWYKNRPFQYTDKFNKILNDIDKKVKR